MYEIERCDLKFLDEIDSISTHTIFTTVTWVTFLQRNQKAEPVILKIKHGESLCAVFVGMTIKKYGVKILGSPFEGWLTCDMGFIHFEEFDVNEVSAAIAQYAFKVLKCWYVQITDKKIIKAQLNNKTKYYMSHIVYLDNSKNPEETLLTFTRNGRRDVRASERKGAIVKRVAFDRTFMDEYYRQLIDVFDKQGLKPFYSLNKLYELVDTFKNDEEHTLALMAWNPEGQPIASLFSFGYGDWAYYVGAASYREFQKLLPNELLFWRFIKHWNEKGIHKIDLVGVRDYKMKYAPILVDQPILYYERIKGIKIAKEIAKKGIEKYREFKTRTKTK